MAWLSDWANRRKVTVDNTNIDSDLTHFPVPIVLGASVGQSDQDVTDIFDELGSDSLKIAVTKPDGTTQIYAEIEQWDDGNEKALLWVSKSDLTLTAASVTELYIYYDSTKADNTTYIGVSGSRTEVWNSGFIARYGMAQDPTGISPQIIDSSGNSNNGSAEASYVSGDLQEGIPGGKALYFEASAGKYITFTGITFPTGTDLKFSLWVYLDEMGGHNSGFWRVGDNFCITDGGVGCWVRWDNSDILTDSSFPWNLAAWNKADYIIKDADTVEFYLNGILKASANHSATNDTFDITDLGYQHSTGESVHGLYDNVSFETSIRSYAWIKADYHAQTDNLLTFSAAEEPPATEVICPTAAITAAGFLDTILIDNTYLIDIEPAELELTANEPSNYILRDIGTADITLAGDVSYSLLRDITTAIMSLSADLSEPLVIYVADIPTAQITLTAEVLNTPYLPVAVVNFDGTSDTVLISRIMAAAQMILSGDSIDINQFTKEFADVYFLFTLTGSADGETNIEIPITSFQCRQRSEDSTYLNVVVPGLDYADEIVARSNGDLQIDMAYKEGESYLQRETIIEVHLEDVRVDEGENNQSITLTGHKQSTYSAQAITVSNVIYKRTSNGAITLRLAQPNVHIRAGNEITYGSDTFIASLISYSISVDAQTMEISE